MAGPKILYVSAVPDFKGGAEVVLRTMLANPYVVPVLAVPEEGPLADTARAMGLEVCCYHPGAMMRVHRPPRPGPIAAAGVDLIRCAVRLRRLAHEHGCAIVHSNGLKPHMLSTIMRRMTRIPTLVHLHDIPYSRAERAIWRVITAGADAVAVVSPPCYPAPVLPPKAGVLLNGVTMVHETLPPPRRAGPLRLGFVGRFHPNKGMDVLLDWFAAIRRNGLAATLTIRGRPDPDLPEYWDAIRARIQDEGLAQFVMDEGWTTGSATYAGLDVLLMTSKVPDPAPLVVGEARSAGVVVAGYPAGGIPWMVADNETGLLVRDGEELAGRLSRLLQEPGAFERIRHAGHDYVRTRHGMDHFHRRLEAAYRAMLAGAAAPFSEA